MRWRCASWPDRLAPDRGVHLRLRTWLAGAAVVVTAAGCVNSGQHGAREAADSASPSVDPGGTTAGTTVEGLAVKLKPVCQQVSTSGELFKGSLTCVAAHDTAIVVVAPSRQELVDGINRGQLPPANWVNRLVAGPNWYLIASSSRFAAQLAQLTDGDVGTLPGVRTVP